MSKRILIQLDPDPQPSSFDSVVAIDSDVDHLFRYGDVQVTSVTPLVHGAMFTRGGDDLRNTASAAMTDANDGLSFSMSRVDAGVTGVLKVDTGVLRLAGKLMAKFSEENLDLNN